MQFRIAPFTILLNCIFLALVSCSQKQSKDVCLVNISDSPLDVLKASEIFDELKVVKIETNKDVLIGEIKSIKEHNGKLYVLDEFSDEIHVIDIETGLQNTSLYRLGHASYEYSTITGFEIDEVANTIEIFDNNLQKIFIYGLDSLDYKYSFGTSLNVAFNFAKCGASYYFQTNGAQNQIDGMSTFSDVIRVNVANMSAEALMQGYDYNDNRYIEYNDVFTKKNDTLYMSFMWHNCIYKLNKFGEIEPSFKLTLGKERPKSISKASYDERYQFLTQNNDKVLKLARLYMVNQTSQLFEYVIGNLDVIYCLRSSSRNICFREIINDFDDFPPVKLGKPNFYQDNYFFSVFYPGKEENQYFLDEMGLNANDNPIVLLFKLK